MTSEINWWLRSPNPAFLPNKVHSSSLTAPAPGLYRNLVPLVDEGQLCLKWWLPSRSLQSSWGSMTCTWTQLDCELLEGRGLTLVISPLTLHTLYPHGVNRWLCAENSVGPNCLLSTESSSARSPGPVPSWDALWAPRMQLAQQHPTQHQFLLEASPGSSAPGLGHQSKDPGLLLFFFNWPQCKVLLFNVNWRRRSFSLYIDWLNLWIERLIEECSGMYLSFPLGVRKWLMF